MNILLALVVVVLTFLIGSTAGWVVHWLLHTELFKNLAKGHKVHHELYTPADFESEEYRSAGKDNSSFVFIPILTITILLFFFPIAYLTNSWWIYLFVVAEGALVGYLNDKIHDAFHLTNHWLNQYLWFRKLKKLHLIHHVDPKFNHGIIWFGADKIFGTYKWNN